MGEIILKIKSLFIPCKENNYRPKFLESRLLFYCLILLLILKLFTIPFFLFFPKNVFFATIIESTLINFTNQYRQSLGLPALKENPQLEQTALLKAQDMLEKNYFSHYSPEGISPWHWFGISGYKYKVAGENLAIGFLDSEQVHNAWLVSPTHRANLLNPNFQEIGIGILKGDFQGKETTVVVQLFASPVVSPTKEEVKPVEEKPRKVEKEEIKEEEKVEKIEKELVSQPKEPVDSALTISPSRPTLAREELTFKLLSFLSFDYHRLLQMIIYGFLLLIIFSLIINIFVRFDIQHPDLIFKTIIFIGVLILFVIIDKPDLIKFISSDFAIYGN